jgi:hypothetical protein
MKKYFAISLTIFTLAAVVVGASLWVRLFYTSAQNFRSPLTGIEIQPQSVFRPQTERVVVIILSGLNNDTNELPDMPALQQLQQTGASFTVQMPLPSYTYAAWGTLLTGAPPDTNGAPVLDLLPTDLPPLAVDTVLVRAQQTQRTTAVMGAAAWQKLLSNQQPTDTFFAKNPGPESDRIILENALTLIENNQPDLMLVQFSQLSTAFQSHADLDGILQATLTLDNYLEQIKNSLDLSHTVLMVLSDHGYTTNGGYGGSEPGIIWHPLVIVGKNIIPGNYSNVHQTDIAPTISALLGLPAPTAAQGRVLTEMLMLDERQQATIQLALARQRAALSEVYARQILKEQPPFADQIGKDLALAQATFIGKNISGAWQLARLVQQEADRQIVLAAATRHNREKLMRLGAVSLIMAGWGGIMWRWRNRYGGIIIIGAITTISLYHALYQIQGYGYSLSSIDNFNAFPVAVARRTGLSVLTGGAIVTALLLLTREENWLTLLGAGYGLALLTTLSFAVPLGWAFWQNGFTITWRLPAVLPAFWQISALFEVMISAMFGLLLPWPIMAVNLLFSVARRSFRNIRQNPTTLPG